VRILVIEKILQQDVLERVRRSAWFTHHGRQPVNAELPARHKARQVP